MKKVIVTGATGYIGSMLVRALLDKGVEVGIICREQSSVSLLEDIISEIDIFRNDGEQKSLSRYFSSFCPEIVFHLASCFVAEHKPEQVGELIDSNLKFGTQILEAMKGSGCRLFVNASTVWQNYCDSEYDPVCLYAATKEAFEKIIKYYVAAEEFQAISLVISDSYGPRDPRRKVIKLLEEIAMTGNHLDMSGGEQMMDMVYIDDIIGDFIYAGELLLSGKPHLDKYYIKSGKQYSLKEIAEIFAKVTGRKLDITWGGRPYRKREMMTLPTFGESIRPETGRVSLEEGFRKMLADKI